MKRNLSLETETSAKCAKLRKSPVPATNSTPDDNATTATNITPLTESSSASTEENATAVTREEANDLAFQEALEVIRFLEEGGKAIDIDSANEANEEEKKWWTHGKYPAIDEDR